MAPIPATPLLPELARHPSSTTLSLHPLRRAALPGLFAWFGVVMGSWVGRIPALREGAQLSHTLLSFVLLCGGLGAVMSFPLSSQLMASFGGRHTMLISGMGLVIVLPCIGFAPSLPLLMLAVLMLGITASSFDVGMNSVAAHHEKMNRRSAMSLLHACACAGGLTGTAMASMMAGLGISPAMHFLMLSLPLSLLLKLAHAGVAADDRAKIQTKSFTLPRGPLALLGALGFLGSVAEGSIANWSGVFLRDHFAVSAGLAPLSLTAFTTMMMLSRWFGDSLKMRHGARELLCSGALIATVGLFFAVFAPNAYVAIAGFACSGLGLSLIFPFVFSAAGREGPNALVGVASMAYAGSLIGPPVLGGVAHALGLQAAMGMVACLGLVMALVARRARLLDKRSSSCATVQRTRTLANTSE